MPSKYEHYQVCRVRGHLTKGWPGTCVHCGAQITSSGKEAGGTIPTDPVDDKWATISDVNSPLEHRVLDLEQTVKANHEAHVAARGRAGDKHFGAHDRRLQAISARVTLLERLTERLNKHAGWPDENGMVHMEKPTGTPSPELKALGIEADNKLAGVSIKESIRRITVLEREVRRLWKYPQHDSQALTDPLEPPAAVTVDHLQEECRIRGLDTKPAPVIVRPGDRCLFGKYAKIVGRWDGTTYKHKDKCIPLWNGTLDGIAAYNPISLTFNGNPVTGYESGE